MRNMMFTGTVWLAMTFCVVTSGNVVKRSDDTNPMEAVVERLTQDLDNVQSRLQVLENKDAKRIAFLANIGGTATDLVTVEANAPIHFAAVNFNMGNAFDPTLGVFTAPTSGVYIFTFQLFLSPHDTMLIDLMKNGGIVLRARMPHTLGYEDSEASSAVMKARAGDKFWVEINHTGKVEFGPHSFFSGALLSPDE